MMNDKKNSKMMSMSKGSSKMQAGMTNKSPKSCDASTTLKGGSVDEGAVRTGTAKTPPTLGPRTA